jgi:arylsulfatase A-like enzyme
MSSMPRRVVALVLASISALGCGDRVDPHRPRHVILVTIDTLRADHLSCYGARHATSDAAHASSRGSVPGFTIDDIAARGMRFECAFAPRGMTFPSIATLFTGRPPIENCALENGNTLPPGAITLAQRLRSAGFATAAFTSNKLLVPGSGIEKGFDRFFSAATDDKDARAVDTACEWLASQDLAKGPPVFVWLHLTGPHLPYDPAAIGSVDFMRLFTDAGYSGAANGSRELLDKAHTEGRTLSASDVEHVIALYDAEVARIDHLVSRFLAFCAGADPSQPVDVLSNALLVFTADHGEELYEKNLYFGHAKSVYADVLHVPLIVRHPASVRAGSVSTDLVGLEDLMPTILARFDVKPDAPMHGVSFLDVLSGRRDGARAPQFSAWRDRIFGVRTERWHCVWNPDRIEPDETPRGKYPIPEVALFDVARDPDDLADVSAGHADVVRELEASMRQWLKGLHVCAEKGRGPSPERMKALREMGYAGEEDGGEEKNGAAVKH